VDPLATWSSAVVAGHGDVAAGLVEEDQAPRIEPLDVGDEALPQLLDPGFRLLRGGQALFFA